MPLRHSRKWRSIVICVLLVGCPMALAPGAFGATTIGQTAAQPATCDAGPLTITQKTIGLGFGYWATSAGVITAWSIQANATSGEMVKLKLLHATGNLDEYKTVAEDTLRPLTPSVLNTFPNASSTTPVRIPAQTGDKIAVSAPSTSSPCDSFMNAPGDRLEYVASDPPVGASATYLESSAGSRVNISARLEPDADGDGFGDETQDACPTNVSTQLACPVVTPPGKDTQAPLLVLDLSTVQRLRRSGIKVVAQSDERATASLSGVLSVPRVRASKSYRLKRVTSTLEARTKKTLKLKFSGKAYRSARRALRKRKRVRARLTVKLVDVSGNAATEKRTVSLRR